MESEETRLPAVRCIAWLGVGGDKQGKKKRLWGYSGFAWFGSLGAKS
jgi:hypothetical protein